MKCPYCMESIKNWSLKCKHCQADLTTEEAKLKIKGKGTSIKTIGIAVVVGLFLVWVVGMSLDFENMPSSTTGVAPTPRSFEQDCISSYDWSFKWFNTSFKKQLKDPDSYEHMETKYSTNKEWLHTVIVQYRAKNGFWAKDLGSATFKADNDCNIVWEMKLGR